MHFSGGSLAVMFPFKVMSKKSSKLTKGYLVANSTVCIPAAITEECCFKSQIEIVIELLLQNKAKVLDRLERDISSCQKSLNIDFPTIVKTLQEANMLHHYLKNYRANIVDEYEELMTGIFISNNPEVLDRETSVCERDGLPCENDSEFHDSSASVKSLENMLDQDNGAEAIVQRNNQFMFLSYTMATPGREKSVGAKTFKTLFENSNFQKIVKWVEDSSHETISLFDLDYVVLTNYELLECNSDVCREILSSIELNRPEKSFPHFHSKEFFIEEKENSGIRENSPSRKTEKASKSTKIPAQFDYTYYEYQFEKAEFSEETLSASSSKNINNLESSHKASRDDHHEVEVSTKSEELPEESSECIMKLTDHSQSAIEETKKLSKAAIKKMKKQKKKEETKAMIAMQEDPPSKRNKEHKGLEESPPTSSKKGKNPKVIPILPIEPAYSESDAFSFDPDQLKLKQKEAEKQKQASKDCLKDQLLRISEEQDLDEFEKKCTVEINALETLTKKMKQKARRRLRQEIDEEKARRKQLEEDQALKEDNDEDYEDDTSVFRELLKLGNKDVLFNEKILKELLPGPDLHMIKNCCRI